MKVRGAAAERSGTVARGSGIGLRLCRVLAARAGGSLDLVRDGSDGTEFVLRLLAHPN